MNAARISHLINGGNITRWSTLANAKEQLTRQRYHTKVLHGCDGCYWVPSTMRFARELMAVGYEAAS